MTSTCTIRRRSGARDTASNGMVTDEWTVAYTGLPIRVSGNYRSASPTTGHAQQGTDVNLAHRVANLPVSTTDLADGDLIEITAGDNVGLILRITEASWQDQATARRVPVEEATRPRGW